MNRCLLPLLLVLPVVPAGSAAAPGKPPPRIGTMAPLPPAVIDDTLRIGGEDIAAKKLRTRMTVAVRVNGKGPYRFVVDSGADVSVIGAQVARALALPAAAPVMLNGMTDSQVIPRAQVDELQVGPSRLQSLQLPVLREADLGADGMIGIDALVEQRLMLDFEKRLITVEDATRPLPRARPDEVIVVARRRRGQLILTQVRANRKMIDAVIDTGSELTIGNIALRDLLIRRHLDRYTQKVEITGVTGTTVTLYLARIAELQLGPVVFRDIPIAFADVPPFGVFGMDRQPSLLLGTDLMENFRRVSLDFRARKVRFQLRRCETTGIMLSTEYVSRLAVADKRYEACIR